MHWDYFCDIMKDEGFEIGYEQIYKYGNFGNPCDEKIVLFYNTEKKMIAFAQSYFNIKSVNSVKIYGHYKERPNLSCSSGPSKDRTFFHFDFDGREGLKYNLSKIEDDKIVSSTFENDFVWIANLEENNAPDFDYEETAKKYIGRSSENFKKSFLIIVNF